MGNIIFCKKKTRLGRYSAFTDRKDFSVYDLLRGIDRERNSASNGPSFDESGLKFNEFSAQKLVLKALRECFRSLLLSDYL